MQKNTILLIPLALVIFSAVSVKSQFPVYRTTPTPTPTPVPKPAAEPRYVPCPSVGVQPQGPPLVPDGQRAAFIANINGGDPKASPTILWNVSAGYIVEGQNTRRIIVDTTGASATPEKEVKADVWIGGYAPECLLQASAKIRIQPAAMKFGDFGVVPDETVKRNLKALAEYLAQTQDTVYLLVYAGRNNERGFAYNWAKRLKDGLIAEGIVARRI